MAVDDYQLFLESVMQERNKKKATKEKDKEKK